jgi:hypothetical protein
MPFLLLIFLLTHMADGLSFLNSYYITLYAHAQEKDAGAGSSAHELDGEEKEKRTSCGSIGEEDDEMPKKKKEKVDERGGSVFALFALNCLPSTKTVDDAAASLAQVAQLQAQVSQLQAQPQQQAQSFT